MEPSGEETAESAGVLVVDGGLRTRLTCAPAPAAAPPASMLLAVPVSGTQLQKTRFQECLTPEQRNTSPAVRLATAACCTARSRCSVRRSGHHRVDQQLRRLGQGRQQDTSAPTAAHHWFQKQQSF